MDQETEKEVKARWAGQDGEYQRWLRAFQDIGFKLHPGITIKENLINYGRWWKANADRFEMKAD